MLYEILMWVASAWAFSAVAVVLLFALDERAFRRASVPAPAVEAPSVAAQPRELAVSSAA